MWKPRSIRQPAQQSSRNSVPGPATVGRWPWDLQGYRSCRSADPALPRWITGLVAGSIELEAHRSSGRRGGHRITHHNPAIVRLELAALLERDPKSPPPTVD